MSKMSVLECMQSLAGHDLYLQILNYKKYVKINIMGYSNGYYLYKSFQLEGYADDPSGLHKEICEITSETIREKLDKNEKLSR